MSKKKNIPEIRFKGFDDEWESKEFLLMVSRISVISKKFELPRVEYEDIISGIGELNKNIYQKESYKTGIEFEEGDVLFGKLRPYLKNWLLASFRGIAVGDFWVLRGNETNSKFIYFLLQTHRYETTANQSSGTKMPRSDWNLVSKTEFSKPFHIHEQSRIGSYFQHLDKLINLHQKKYDKLAALKKAMLEKMFPKDGSDVPEIRFKGFTEKWEEKELSSIFNKIRNAFVGTATPYYVNNGHFYLESNNVKNGEINRNNEIFINDYFYNRQKENWLHTDDIVMVQSGHVGHCAVIPPELNNTAAHALIIFTDKKERTCSYFLNYQFQTGNSKDQIVNITTGNTIKHILSSEMKVFKVLIPNPDEQFRIGSYFQNLDKLISLQQRELDKLKNIKKACLEKMFV